MHILLLVSQTASYFLSFHKVDGTFTSCMQGRATGFSLYVMAMAKMRSHGQHSLTLQIQLTVRVYWSFSFFPLTICRITFLCTMPKAKHALICVLPFTLCVVSGLSLTSFRLGFHKHLQSPLTIENWSEWCFIPNVISDIVTTCRLGSFIYKINLQPADATAV